MRSREAAAPLIACSSLLLPPSGGGSLLWSSPPLPPILPSNQLPGRNNTCLTQQRALALNLRRWKRIIAIKEMQQENLCQRNYRMKLNLRRPILTLDAYTRTWANANVHANMHRNVNMNFYIYLYGHECGHLKHTHATNGPQRSQNAPSLPAWRAGKLAQNRIASATPSRRPRTLLSLPVGPIALCYVGCKNEHLNDLQQKWPPKKSRIKEITHQRNHIKEITSKKLHPRFR